MLYFLRFFFVCYRTEHRAQQMATQNIGFGPIGELQLHHLLKGLQGGPQMPINLTTTDGRGNHFKMTCKASVALGGSGQQAARAAKVRGGCAGFQRLIHSPLGAASVINYSQIVEAKRITMQFHWKLRPEDEPKKNSID